MSKWIAILKTGTFKDSEGNEHAFTEQRLDAIVAKYNPAEHEAPEVIGHPKDNAPAWGWVGALKREGTLLFYEPKDRVPEFQEMIDKKMFKKRSVSLRSDLTLRHVGWLGAQPPAVKGLPDTAFKEDPDAITFEFSEWKDDRIAAIFQRLRDFFIEKFGLETADKIISSYDINDVRLPESEFSAPPVIASGAKQSQKKEDDMDMDKVQELETKLKEREKEIADFSEKDKEKDAEMAKLSKDLAEERAKNKRAGFAFFCDSGEMKEKITPAMKPAVLDFMEILAGLETYEFSEVDDKGAEKKVQKAPVEAFKAFLNALPKSVDFSEHATKKKAGKSLAGTAGEKLEQLTQEKMKANKDLAYNTAFSEVQNENPELALEYVDELKGGK